MTTTSTDATVQASSSGTVIGATTSAVPQSTLTDSGGNTWSIVNGQVTVNGVADPTSANVIEIAYVNGLIWQENSAKMWWSKAAPADPWTPPTGTSTNPVTGTFFLGNNAQDQAIVNIGKLTAGTGAAASPLSTSEIITSGVQAAGTSILISTNSATLVIDGNSRITQGATLYPLGGYRTPRPDYGPVQNNGDMIVNASTLDFGALSGTGAINAANGSALNIESAGAGNTIRLTSSHLTIGGQNGAPGSFGIPGGLSFLAPISMDAGSTITVAATQATTEVIKGSHVSLYNGSAKVADLTISGQTHIYAIDNPTNDTVTLSRTASASALPISANPPANPGVSVFDTTTSQPISPTVQPYSGPVAGLRNQYLPTTTDNLNITTTKPNWFIAARGLENAIDVSKGGGNNVIEVTGGSSFLTGGTGNDTFLVDDRSATTSAWSTILGFHTGDNVTVWGVTPQDFTLTWQNGQGTPPDTGLTLSATAANRPDANATLVGYTSADLSNGRLKVSFGITPNEPGLPGSPYMQITGT
jgi:hypothetical protein